MLTLSGGGLGSQVTEELEASVALIYKPSQGCTVRCHWHGVNKIEMGLPMGQVEIKYNKDCLLLSPTYSVLNDCFTCRILRNGLTCVCCHCKVIL